MVGQPLIAGVAIEFILFGLTLASVALFHKHTLQCALIGLATITLYKLSFANFAGAEGLSGLATHLGHEWVVLSNLFALLVGFALLAQHFENSHLPARLPHYLPDDWKGGLVLLGLVFVLSSFLDNIAAAMIGGTVAATVFRNRLHIGYFAAIVAASNAGGSGSVIGDTTTTMMWIEGISPLDVVHAYVAAIAAFCVFAIPASLQQQRYSPIVKDDLEHVPIDGARLMIVLLILIAAAGTNIFINLQMPERSEAFPFIGVAVVATVLLTSRWRRPDWSLVPDAARGSVFLLSLVLAASMMPVEQLPAASWINTLELGFLSAVFDNIPLTKLALDAGGYDWGFLAYAVGFGGSMIWLGSSAGVALSNRFPESRSALAWIRGGWHVILGYVVGFFVLLLTLGWHPYPPH
ncbi:MAG: citrate transporter [Gammaproteobacteria bacterium]|nr:citrate transporter [Gammaproteobacteria bacterium]